MSKVLKKVKKLNRLITIQNGISPDARIKLIEHNGKIEKIVKKLTICDVVSSLNVDEKTFLYEILMEKKLKKDDDGKYKILEDLGKDRMLDNITRKLLFF